MRHANLVVQLLGVAFLCLSIALTGSASKREELERAAELAVERAAERVAEKAVEKALETGNSSTETETIRTSHSSVRKYDYTQQLPSYTYYTPQERKDHLRIAKEREAGELAVQQIRHTLFKRQISDPSFVRGPEDFDDVGPSFASGGNIDVDAPSFGTGGRVDIDDPSFGRGSSVDVDDVGPSFGRIGRLSFDSVGPSFGRPGIGAPGGPGGASGATFTPTRFIRQYPFGNPYQYGHYEFVPVQQDQRAAPKQEAKPPAEAPKEKKTPQVAPVVRPLITPVKVYQVETKPVFYYAPPTSHYPVQFAYHQPTVKILTQDLAADGKRDRRGWPHA